ncbi:MAG: addiction module protein [Candidatus Kapabacteria bacterium]|nr:addiction module protein [Candidatus Kapabacteria bacterium]
MTHQELRDSAMRLPIRDRAALVMELLASMDSSESDDTSALWASLSEERYEQYLKDKRSIPASEVLYKLAQRLES